MDVDLGVSETCQSNFGKGTTNPGDRDKQIREPVFVVSKDFVPGTIVLRAGMAVPNRFGHGLTVRPLGLNGASGVIPKVKVNYTDIASICGANKDTCRNTVELVVRHLSDKAKVGESCQMDIPFVGTFIVRSNVAAVSFLTDLYEDTRGVTRRTQYEGRGLSNSVSK